VEWTNWYRNLRCRPEVVERPRTEDEVRDAVRRAADAGLRVRVAGAGHSNVALVPTDGMLLDLSALRGVVAADGARRQATILAGTPIADIGPLLWREGLALRNQGDIDSQCLAGAVATGTHGTGRELGSLSGAVAGARIVAADGEPVEAGPDDPALLRAARTALGALGPMTSITLDVTDAYCLDARLHWLSWDDALARWDELLASHRHVTFYWCPTARSGAWLPLDPPVPADGVIVRTMDALPPDAPARGPKHANPFVDRAHRVFPDVYEPNFHELEYMVPAPSAKDAVASIRALISDGDPDQEFPVEVRFVAADDAMLSPFAGRDSCSISVSAVMGADNQALFADCDRELAPFGARPHWGKWHAFTVERVGQAFPELDAFRAVRARLDPDGLFLNDHVAGILGSARLESEHA
jgi:L-gulono-1,4-lactone dehydrogenase